MRRIFFVTALMAALYSCTDSSTNISKNKDTVTPQGVTTPTPNNPGGLQPNGISPTTNNNNLGGTDTTTNGGNTHQDSMRQ